MSEWFKLSSNVVDRDDLSIYEKMCCVVLARYSDEDDISLDYLALKMGVEEIVAKGAFYSLMSRGILELVDKSQNIRPGTIIKAKIEEETKHEKEATIESIEEEAVDANEFRRSDLVLSNEEKVHRVCEIIDEKLSEREAKIILSFANNDINKIIEKYKIAKASQYSDKIEVLIHELQKKDETNTEIAKSNVIKKTDYEKTETIKLEAISQENAPVQKSQLNTYKINLMKKYKGK